MYIKSLLSRNDTVTVTVGVKREFSMIGRILNPCVTKIVSKRVCVFSNTTCKSQFGGSIYTEAGRSDVAVANTRQSVQMPIVFTILLRLSFLCEQK